MTQLLTSRRQRQWLGVGADVREAHETCVSLLAFVSLLVSVVGEMWQKFFFHFCQIWIPSPILPENEKASYLEMESTRFAQG